MNNLIVGMGEIGTALEQVINSYDVQTLDLEKKTIKGQIDVMHICIPYSDKFKEQVKNYQKRFKPMVTVVYSTVPIGTCKELGVMHSPVEGKHPNLASSIERSTRWISNDGSIYPMDEFWAGLAIDIQEVNNTDFTEFLKLRSTAKYGINLVWADYEKQVADDIGMDFELLKAFDRDYNKLYKPSSDLTRVYQRYVLDAPEGKIGGHCVVPNAELLDKQYPNDMLKMIRKMK